jgi:hypothetical protein
VSEDFQENDFTTLNVILPKIQIWRNEVTGNKPNQTIGLASGVTLLSSRTILSEIAE